jgi:hypothetical protein
MPLYEDLKQIVSQLSDTSDTLNIFADPLRGWAIIDPPPSWEEELEKEIKGVNILSSDFSSLILYNVLDKSVDSKRSLIEAFNLKADNGEIIPIDDYYRLQITVYRDTNSIRHLLYLMPIRLKDKETSLEHFNKWDMFKNRYFDLLFKLNECIKKYNNKQPEAMTLEPLFSGDTSPLSTEEYYEILGIRDCVNPPKYSLPVELTEEYAKSRTMEERFVAMNEFRVKIGEPPFTYEEYLEWRKT